MRGLARITALAALVMFTGGARADMLWWMIGDATNGGSNRIAFNYAVVYAVEGENRIALPDDGMGGEIYGNEDLSPITSTGPHETALGPGFDWRNSSYYIELLAWDGVNETMVGYSESLSYAELVSRGYVIPSGISIPTTAAVWMPTTSVPEPMSGTLLLLGFAALCLRRRL